MATYDELWDLGVDSDLRNRVGVALVIASQIKLAGTPTATEASYAAQVLGNPRREADSALYAVLAANESASVAQIQSATDAAIQTNVDAIFDALVTAHGAA